MSRRELVSQLVANKVPIVTSLDLDISLKEEWKQENPPAIGDVLDFLDRAVGDMVKALNPTLLEELYKSLKEDVMNCPYPQMDSQRVQSADFEQISAFIAEIHKNVQAMYLNKEEVIHNISIFSSAVQVLESFQKASEGLVKRRFPTQKKPAADFPRFAAIVEDVEIYISRLKGWVSEFNEYVEKVANSRVNHLLRLESSVRLLEKYRDRDGEWDVKT